MLIVLALLNLVACFLTGVYGAYMVGIDQIYQAILPIYASFFSLYAYHRCTQALYLKKDDTDEG